MKNTGVTSWKPKDKKINEDLNVFDISDNLSKKKLVKKFMSATVVHEKSFADFHKQNFKNFFIIF